MSKRKPKISLRFEVSVWNIIDGDLVAKRWEADETELEEIEERYGDDPFHQIIIDREWEEDDDA